ncbi:MAG TPA: cupin domain-containing protein [Vicinamibacteria bacterium]|nr:cupin domain-containing protein [Vicinamibacteria bacterium]
MNTLEASRTGPILFASALGLLATAGPAVPQTPHVMVTPEALVWQPSSRVPGLMTAVAEGDPTKAGPFVLMLKLADGSWIPPHWHNADKRLVVVRGTLRMGMGDRVEEATTRPLAAGGVAMVPAGSRHYEGASGETLVALLATGPFTTAFVERGVP